jgi:signal transduction histidine kinase
MWTGFFVGVAIGVLVAIPFARAWTRRTERRVRALERRARTAERLAELGTMTSGLAHEIKNPLSTVGLNAQLLHEDLADAEQVASLPPQAAERIGRAQRRLESLRRETQRLRDTLEDFLRFAGRIVLERKPIDAHGLIGELVDFFEPQTTAAGIRLSTQLTAERPVAPIDSGHLKQALLNLLINATQAMTQARERGEPHGGASELFVRTRNQRHLDRDELVIEVTDTGPGIAADAVKKIFHPYFSTKRGGTGLGLPTARRIAEEHGGRLTVHSEPARGTSFTLTLPLENPAERQGGGA